MRDYPKGGIIGRSVRLLRAVQEMKIPLHAANACYFMVLAVFPALLLLLSLLRYTPVEVEQLGEMLYDILPEMLAVGAEELILLTYDNTTGTVVGISAASVLWSASRGVYGVLTGLNAIYGVSEERGYFHLRFLSVVCLFVLLVLLLLTPGMYMVSHVLPPVGRFFGLLTVQTAFFAAIFMALPGERSSLWESFPGALLAALGWQIFSDLYSVYVEYFATLSNIYGSVYAVALSMLWLYCCMSILFYGGALNVLLKNRKNVS